MKKKSIIFILIILIFATLVFSGTIYNGKLNKKEYSIAENSSIAIMVQDEATGEYIKKTKVPVGKYILNRSKSYCTYGGEIKTYDGDKGTLYYSLKTGDKCYVYFDAATFLSSAIVNLESDEEYISSQDGSVFVVRDQNGFRYEGTNPDNYVTFNGEEWRIIGAFEGSTIGLDSGKYYTKIIRANYTGDTLARGNSTTTEWAVSPLHIHLNGTYYNSISSSNRNMIAKATWYLGAGPFSYSAYTALDFYNAERSTTLGYGASSLSIQNHIGLMYPSDWGYAMYAGSANTTCNNTTTTLQNYGANAYGNTGLSECYRYDWLSMSGGVEWSITSVSDPAAGYTMNNSLKQITAYGVGNAQSYRPTLYLDDTVMIADGDGTKANPYQLEYDVDNTAYDVTIATATNGSTGTLPSSGVSYSKEVTCSKGSASWSDKYNRLEIDDLKSLESCTVNYVADNTNKTLINKMTELAAVDNWTKLYASSADYATLTQGSSYGFTADTSAKTWTSNNTNVSSSSSTITLSPKYPGEYRLCYTVGSEKNYDYGTVTVNGTQVLTTKGSSTTSFTCVSLGTISSADSIVVTYSKDGSVNTAPDQFVFYIEFNEVELYGSSTDIGGLRYVGKNPNNFIWFNNELWRILGAVNTKVDSSGTEEYLVKIVRNSSIGNYMYTDSSYASSTVEWGTGSTLYNLLNNGYYSTSISGLDQSGSSYCMHINDPGMKVTDAECDFTHNGIYSNSYYGKMVRKAYWKTGGIRTDSDLSSNLSFEEATYNVNDYVGLLSVFDVRLASKALAVSSIILDSYTKYLIDYNWLYNGPELTMNHSLSGSYVYYITNTAIPYLVLSNNAMLLNSQVRPVVHLDPSVYVISGTGSATDPYIIGM